MRCLCANTNQDKLCPQSSKAKVLICFASKQVFMTTLEDRSGGGGERGDKGGQLYQSRWPDEAHEMQPVHDTAARDKADWCEDLVEGGLRQ